MPTAWLPARSLSDPIIPDEIVERACAAYWWHLSPGCLTWADLVEQADHRIPAWREKMRAALTAVNCDEEQHVDGTSYSDERSESLGGQSNTP